MAAHPRPDSEPLHSLAEAAPGERVEVVHILFGSLRQRFEDLGIRVGSRVRVRERGAHGLVVELAGGATLSVDAVHAAFVEVRPPLADSPHGPAVPASRHLTAGTFPDRSRTGDPAPNPHMA
jgi:Fe2+ transport system protein FeoA